VLSGDALDPLLSSSSINSRVRARSLSLSRSHALSPRLSESQSGGPGEALAPCQSSQAPGGHRDCRGLPLRGAACAGKGKSGWLFFPGTFSCGCPSGGYWGPPIHNIRPCGWPGEGPNAWKQFGPKPTLAIALCRPR
jgi:hypothetical protein